VEGLADFVFHPIASVHSPLGFVVDGVAPRYVVWATGAFVYFLLGEGGLVEEVQFLGLDRSSEDVGRWLTWQHPLELKPSVFSCIRLVVLVDFVIGGDVLDDFAFGFDFSGCVFFSPK